MAGQAFAYDANGNMTGGLDGKQLRYDAENRLIKVVQEGITTIYVYGADGARLKRIEGDETTLTIGAIEVRDYDGPRESLVSYPDPAVRIEGSRTSYLHTDHLGSLRAASDAAGTRIELRSYRGYGEMTRYSDGLSQEDHSWIGERRDAGAGLMYVNARYHDPELGMFVSPDWFEVTDPGVGTNRYASAGGDPINQSDPGGNASIQHSDGSWSHHSPDSAAHKAVASGGPAGARYTLSLDDGYSRSSGMSIGDYVNNGTGSNAAIHTGPIAVSAQEFPEIRDLFVGLGPLPWIYHPRVTGRLGKSLERFHDFPAFWDQEIWGIPQGLEGTMLRAALGVPGTKIAFHNELPYTGEMGVYEARAVTGSLDVRRGQFEIGVNRPLFSNSSPTVVHRKFRPFLD